jgi:hypothetical protein
MPIFHAKGVTILSGANHSGLGSRKQVLYGSERFFFRPFLMVLELDMGRVLGRDRCLSHCGGGGSHGIRKQ